MKHHVLSIISLLSIVPCYANSNLNNNILQEKAINANDVTTISTNGRIESNGTITAENILIECGRKYLRDKVQSEDTINVGHRIEIDRGSLRNIKVQDDLVLDVKENLAFSDSSIGNTLTVNSGTVELKNMDIRHLIIKNNAAVSIDNKTCTIENITIDADAVVTYN